METWLPPSSRFTLPATEYAGSAGLTCCPMADCSMYASASACQPTGVVVSRLGDRGKVPLASWYEWSASESCLRSFGTSRTDFDSGCDPDDLNTSRADAYVIWRLTPGLSDWFRVWGGHVPDGINLPAWSTLQTAPATAARSRAVLARPGTPRRPP